MLPDERIKFADLLTDAMAYYGKDVSDFMLSVFWDSLKRFEFADVSHAFTLHAQNPDNGQWAPKVADIVKMIEGSTQTQGMQAWAKVQSAIGSVGKMKSVAFDDPLIHAVIAEMGGWYSLCCSLVEELPFKAREFEKRYQGYRVRREVPQFAPYLIGGHEADNRLNGYKTPAKPVLIGDPARAALVMEKGSEQPALKITDTRHAITGAVKQLTNRYRGGEPPEAA